ncbi:MAG TPA: quinoprotein relay system zinc metallohydrolase 2 [Rhodanobacteraceae bacterium]|jgi:quinoprotein relay system zinc metallohydrolase 2|nr:quinoprotein relay system zinc metallohydrolase 2 [Rhodanobacteraceae bacterium]
MSAHHSTKRRARAALMLLMVCAGVAAHAEKPTALDVGEIAPGIFVHFGKMLALDAPGHDDIANVGFIVGTRCVAVVDTGGSMRIGRALRESVRRHSNLPVCYVINTHDHVDHVLGNAAFKDDRPIFVGHFALVAALKRDSAFFVEHYADDLDAPATSAEIIGPDKTVTTTLELDLGGRRLKLQAWPKAHTDCDLTVQDDRTRVLWTGDLVFRERIPALDGSVVGWLADIDQLARVDAAIIVPGHGAATRDAATALDPERRYLEAVRDGVRKALAEGRSIEQAAAEVAASERSHWLLWDTAHAHNVSRAYQELEWE